MNTRIEYIDSVKGIAILLVVMGHVIANFFPSWKVALNETPSAMYWWSFIYSFHMPLLFFVSGFLFLSGRIMSGNLLLVWLHKVKPLVLPFVFMGIIRYLITGQTDSYWFLRTLFLYIIVWIIYEILKRRFILGWKIDVLFMLCIYLISDFLISGRLENNPILNQIFDFPHFLGYWLYFSFGVLTRSHFNIDRVLVNKYFVTIVSGIVILHIATLFNDKPLFIRVLCIACVILSVFVICKQCFVKGRLSEALRYIGRHTLEIYIIHMFFIVNIPIIGETIASYCLMGGKYVAQGLALELVFSLILTIINITMCVIVYEPLKAFPILYECFLGRKVK